MANKNSAKDETPSRGQAFCGHRAMRVKDNLEMFINYYISAMGCSKIASKPHGV